MQELSCPVCKSDKYLNPQLKLLVSPCFHKMCESCVSRLFSQGPSPCPLCKTILRKTNFIQQTFEDLYVEKEIGIRQKTQRFFNKRLQDFNNNLREYNDYLEHVEDIMYNLANDIDVQKTQEKIDTFRQQNKQLIERNQSQQIKEDRVINFQLEKERKEKILRKEAYLKLAHDKLQQKQQQRKHVISQLMDAETDEIAKEIYNQNISQIAAEEASSSVIQYRAAEEIDLNDHAELKEYDIDIDDIDGFVDSANDYIMTQIHDYKIASDYVDPWTLQLKTIPKSQIARAGGYVPKITYTKAISCAFSNVLLNL